MNKNLFIFLFPEREYMKRVDPETRHLLDEAIRRRYKEKGYDFAVARYKNSEINIGEPSDKIIDANITFQQSTPYYTENWEYADFQAIASSLAPDLYEQIRVGGYHCFDCVQKLAVLLYERNPSTIIDTDLTEFFPNRATTLNRPKSQKLQELHYEVNPNFDFENYIPEKTFEEILSTASHVFEFRQLVKTYEHPVFGMAAGIEKLKTKFAREQHSADEITKT
ncbi:MAG: hypothetical protein FWE31_02010 [Firmicutes bacterium]|nr:hypothetical protein [Bacillota bacterium]